MSSILAQGNITGFTTDLYWQNITLDDPISLTRGAYAIVFNDTSTDLDANFFTLYADLDDFGQSIGRNETQTGTFNTTMSWEFWYIEAPTSDFSVDGKDLRFQIHYNNSEINAEDYNVLKISFRANDSISTIIINDFDGNQVCTDSTGWSANTWYIWSCDLSDDVDWGSLEHGLQFNFTSATSTTIQFTNATLFSDFSQLSVVGESISSSFQYLIMRFNNTSMIDTIELYDADGNSVGYPEFYETGAFYQHYESGYRHEFVGRLASTEGWSGTETELHIKFNWNITDPITSDFLLMDYILMFSAAGIRNDFFATNLGDAFTFNDGTIEELTLVYGGTIYNENNQYLRVDDNADSVIRLNRTTVAFSGVSFDHLYFRFWINKTVETIEVRDNDGGGLVCQDLNDLAANEWHTFYCDLDDDPDWDSTEIGITIDIITKTSGLKLLRVDYIQLLTGAPKETFGMESWTITTIGALEDQTDIVIIPNGTDGYLRFYLYPSNKQRQILRSGSSFAAEADYHTYFYYLYIENFYVDVDTNNTLEVGFLSDTTGLNWIDFNTTQFDNNLTDQWRFNDINTTVRNIMIPLWNVTGWEGTITEVYINVTDSNNEQHFMLDGITIDKFSWTHNPDIIYGLWDKVNDVPLLDIKHSIMSYWTYNASFRTEITMYDGSGGVAASYNSSLIYFNATADVIPFYRVLWDYNLLESEFDITFFDDGGNDLWDADFGTDFTIYDPNPKVFDTGGLIPSVYYRVDTSTDEPVIAYTDFIKAQFKEREWTNTQLGIGNPNWFYNTPFRQEGNNSGTFDDGNYTAWSLTVSNLDSVSGTLSTLWDVPSFPTITDTSCANARFRIFNVNKSNGGLELVMAIVHSSCAVRRPLTYLYNNTFDIVWDSDKHLPKYAMNATWSGTEFSLTTRDDRQFVDVSIRHHYNLSDDSYGVEDAFLVENIPAISTDWSQEYVLELYYSTSGFGVDEGWFKMQTSDFAFTSRGWLEDIAGAIFNPILDIIGGLLKALWDIFVAIFTPLIMFLAWILSLALSGLGAIFQFAIDGLGVILDTLGSVLDTIFGVLGQIWDWLSEFFGAILDILLDWLDEMLDWILTTVLPWIIAQILFIWDTLFTGIINIIDSSGGLKTFFDDLFQNDPAEAFTAALNIINLIFGLLTLIWIGLTFYIFTSPAFQAQGDANRYASEFVGNAFTWHGVVFSVFGFNIPLILPTIVWWLLATVLLGYLDWVVGWVTLW
jgi:hypothetical protein